MAQTQKHADEEDERKPLESLGPKMNSKIAVKKN
jgi:hypothetical protein